MRHEDEVKRHQIGKNDLERHGNEARGWLAHKHGQCAHMLDLIFLEFVWCFPKLIVTTLKPIGRLARITAQSQIPVNTKYTPIINGPQMMKMDNSPMPIYFNG